MNTEDINDIEFDLLLEGIFRRYGYDFRDYAKASLRRRVALYVEESYFKNLGEACHALLHNEQELEKFLHYMSVTVTQIFRDPEFFATLRKDVLPKFAKRDNIRIWIAGCATGEEVYSIAILLKEEGLYERSLIYATDYNNKSLQVAENGIYPAAKIKEYLSNYRKTQPKASFADYYHAKYGNAKFSSDLRQNISFANHNLVNDGSFGAFDLLICRNVLIYFNKTLQDHVLKLFLNSLYNDSFLCLGSKESLRFSAVEDQFDIVSQKWRIYKRKPEL